MGVVGLSGHSLVKSSASTNPDFFLRGLIGCVLMGSQIFFTVHGLTKESVQKWIKSVGKKWKEECPELDPKRLKALKKLAFRCVRYLYEHPFHIYWPAVETAGFGYVIEGIANQHYTEIAIGVPAIAGSLCGGLQEEAPSYLQRFPLIYHNWRKKGRLTAGKLFNVGVYAVALNAFANGDWRMGLASLAYKFNTSLIKHSLPPTPETGVEPPQPEAPQKHRG